MTDRTAADGYYTSPLATDICQPGFSSMTRAIISRMRPEFAAIKFEDRDKAAGNLERLEEQLAPTLLTPLASLLFAVARSRRRAQPSGALCAGRAAAGSG